MDIATVLQGKGRHVETVQPTDTVGTAVRALAERGIGAVVVREPPDRLVGIFSERDLVRVLARDGHAALEHTMAAVMSRPVYTCVADDRIETVLAQMTKRKMRHMPVVEGDTIVGIVSIGDLVKHRFDEKELEAAVLLDRARLSV